MIQHCPVVSCLQRGENTLESSIEAIEASKELYRHSSSLHRTSQTGQVESDYLFYLNVTGHYCAIGHKTNILLMKAVIQCNTDSTRRGGNRQAALALQTTRQLTFKGGGNCEAALVFQ